jgi:RND family efflux transporter MFP subunit
MLKNIYKITLISLLFLFLSVFISGCGQKTEVKQENINPGIDISAQSVKDSRVLKQDLEYPAIVGSDQEAKIIAKSGGTAKNIKFNVGDKVGVGAVLGKIDDINSRNANSSGFDSSQVKQAIIGVEQAANSYHLAQINYQNILISSEKDLKQAEIGQNSAITGEANLNITTSEAYKSAELAYQTAKIAAENARQSLANIKKSSTQSTIDIKTNADTIADSAANACGTIITSINNALELDEDKYIGLPYKANLGVLEIGSRGQAETAYIEAKNLYEKYLLTNFDTINNKVDATIKLAESVKKLADAAKRMLDKSITSASLPLVSLTGSSLSGLNQAVAGFQAQLSGILSQINGAKQGLTNTALGIDTTLQSLEKAYEIATNQEAQAGQALENLKAGNKSASDQAKYGVDAAANQFANIKIKLDSQIAVARSQLEMSRLVYSNASLALQGLYDSRQLISPISGTITKKFVNEGDTISPSQMLAVVSQPENIKLKFYVDQENLSYIKLGQTARIISSDRESSGRVVSITPQADEITKRFLVEVAPDKRDSNFILGTIMSVILEINKKTTSKNTIILPLSAIEVGQNANNIFIINGGKAFKKQVQIVKVEGEAAEIKIDLPDETMIVVKNNKLLQEGDAVNLK